MTISRILVAKIALGICILGILCIIPFAYFEIEELNYYNDVAQYLTYTTGPLGNYHDSESCDLCKNKEKYPELYEKHIRILHEANISTNTLPENISYYQINLNLFYHNN
ncbi:hypothetical protein [Methanococcus maripaludis]|uniref:Uncharacterized protein n=1 Tax=Methanococcus maripaludis TaxID=39152 RepID=A0A7J9PMD9_METMI|nr:hypothetical protein [Methanococcus maripaludis]MBA2863988.1 hypothetical protein [Methanococcus maripaludis]